MTATWTKLKKDLAKLDKAELIGCLGELCDKVPKAREFILLRFRGKTNSSALNKYKAIIEKEFFPTRGFGKLRIATAKKAISDYKKLTQDLQGTLDLMLVLVENGIDFFNAYGDISSSAVNSLHTVMQSISKELSKEENRGYISTFRDRFVELQEQSDGIGYGLGDEIGGQIEDLLDLNNKPKKGKKG